MRILAAAMVLPMVLRRLNQARVLENRNQTAIPGATPVSPLMDLVGINSYHEHEHRHPTQPPQEIRSHA